MTSLIKYSEFNFDRDSKDIYNLIKPMWPEWHLSKNQNMPFDPDLAHLEKLTREGFIKGVVGHVGDKLVAVYICSISTYIFSKDHIVATEVMWCFDKKYRSIKNLNRLLKVIDNLHILHGVQVSQMCMHHSRAERLMNKRDYKLDEYWYFKEYK